MSTLAPHQRNDLFHAWAPQFCGASCLKIGPIHKFPAKQEHDSDILKDPQFKCTLSFYNSELVLRCILYILSYNSYTKVEFYGVSSS